MGGWAACEQVSHMSSSYMMQHFDFCFPSLRDSQLSEMHSREEEEEEKEDWRTVSSSHTFPSNQSQIIWQLILIQAAEAQVREHLH